MTHSYSSTRPQAVAKDYGCRNFGVPHDFEVLFENGRIKVERCKRCNGKVRFRKHYKGRTDNRAYLEAHARNFAQRNGRTKRVWHRVHQPDKLIIRI